MAGGGSIGGSKRRKSLDAEINLVPFIDLLSVCICFLLMTAVWIQIGSLNVKQSHGTDAPVAAKDQLDVEMKFQTPTSVDVVFKKSGRVVKSLNAKGEDLKSVLGKLDLDMKAFLNSVGGKPDTRVASGMITPKLGVNYGDLVAAMDLLRKHDIKNLGVVPVKGN